jgi:dipeptidyl-peptidase-4
MFAVTLGLLPLCTACTLAPAARGLKLLTLETIYGPDRVDFDGSYASDLKWLPDGQHYLERRQGTLQRVDALTDEATPAYDYAALAAALESQGQVDAGTAHHLARNPTILSEDHSAAVLEHDGRLYFYRFTEGTLQRLTDQAGERRELTLSPDSAHVAFVQDNNLYAIEVASGQQTQLTQDGSETMLNGVLDWVYQEEIFGRGHWRSYWWSPDGEHVAYLQLDESQVPVYTLVDQMPTHPRVEQLRFPKAGDPNPIPCLGFVSPQGGPTVWADLSRYDPADLLIYPPGWSPDGWLVYTVQDREGRWLELSESDPRTGQTRTLLRETTPAFVHNLGLPYWLPDGSFLWRSAPDGWPHLYHYTCDGELIRRITAGLWEVRELHGVDPDSQWVYFSGTRDSPVELHAYRVALAGGQVCRLTEPGFSHHTNFDPQFGYFIDTFSNLSTPRQVQLRRSDGELVRVISANQVPALSNYQLSSPEILRIAVDNGHTLNAVIIRPLNVKPGRKYPVVHFVYGGPHMPAVRNGWGGDEYMFQQLLAQKGYIVWTCDPYSASGEGEVSAWHCDGRLGVTELEDLEAGLRWLGQHENADLSRVAIFGHSYGGYMTAYALTHSRMFKVGIAAAPLTDWRNYDTVYTERYLRTPQDNPQGYEQSSVLAGAENLHGRLLLVHGLLDDNVHVQSTLQLCDELQQAGKEFDLMLYPRDGHGFHHAEQHWRRLRLHFIERNL